MEKCKLPYKESGAEDSNAISDRRRTNYAVYSRRWEEVKNASNALDVELLEAEVLWGKEAVAIQKPLRKRVSELFAVVQRFLDERDHLDAHDVLYGSLDPDDASDKFALEVNAVVKPIEDYLRPHLRIDETQPL